MQEEEKKMVQKNTEIVEFDSDLDDQITEINTKERIEDQDETILGKKRNLMYEEET